MAKKRETKEEYYQNPNHCLQCGSIIKLGKKGRAYIGRNKKFCNVPCCTTYYATRRTPRGPCYVDELGATIRLCPQGHNVLISGRTKRGLCIECSRATSRVYQRTPKAEEQRRRFREKDFRSQKYMARHLRAQSSIKGLFSQGKSAARIKQLTWDITKEQFAALRAHTCHYCGQNLPTQGTGLDRKDNSRGYTLANVLPCCKDCNRIRSNVFTVQEMEQILGPAIAQTVKQRAKSNRPIRA